MGNLDCLSLALSAPPLLFIPAGHQYSVVHRGPQLDSPDYNGCHKGEPGPSQKWNPHIDENGALYNQNQNHRQGNGLKY